MDMNQMVEEAIIGKLVTTLVDEGFRVELSDQDGGGLFVYAAADGGSKPLTRHFFWKSSRAWSKLIASARFASRKTTS